MNLEATQRQRAILKIIERQCSLGESAPTLREIGQELGIPNVSAVAKHVQALRRKGLLGGLDGKSRGLRVISPLRAMQRAVANIPIFGSIPAGFAQEREQSAEGCVTVDIGTLGFNPGRNTFALRVAGDSMIGRHIVSGDVVILEHGVEPHHRDIVAALIDGECTLKTFFIEDGKSFLRAENPKYPDLIPAEELMVQGVFKTLIRSERGHF